MLAYRNKKDSTFYCYKNDDVYRIVLKGLDEKCNYMVEEYVTRNVRQVKLIADVFFELEEKEPNVLS